MNERKLFSFEGIRPGGIILHSARDGAPGPGPESRARAMDWTEMIGDV